MGNFIEIISSIVVGFGTIILIGFPAIALIILENRTTSIARFIQLLILPIALCLAVTLNTLYAPSWSYGFANAASLALPFTALLFATEPENRRFGLAMHGLTYFAGYVGKSVALGISLFGITEFVERPKFLWDVTVYLIGRSLGADTGDKEFAAMIGDNASNASGFWDIFVAILQVVGRSSVNAFDSILSNGQVVFAIFLVGYLLNFVILSTSAIITRLMFFGSKT